MPSVTHRVRCRDCSITSTDSSPERIRVCITLTDQDCPLRRRWSGNASRINMPRTVFSSNEICSRIFLTISCKRSTTRAKFKSSCPSLLSDGDTAEDAPIDVVANAVLGNPGGGEPMSCGGGCGIAKGNGPGGPGGPADDNGNGGGPGGLVRRSISALNSRPSAAKARLLEHGQNCPSGRER